MAGYSQNCELPEMRWSSLMNLTQKGDKDAYRELLTELYPFLRSFCFRRCGNLEIAEDVVQNALFALHEARHTYLPALPFTNWILVITRHKLIDELRKRGRREVPVDLSNDEFNFVTSFEDNPYHTVTADQERPDMIFERNEVADSVRQAVAALPSTFKQAIQLVKFDEMTIEEASEQLAEKPSLIKVRVHRALLLLKKRLLKKRQLEEVSWRVDA